MRTIHLYHRDSHKYRAGWSYLDQETFVTSATELEHEGAECTDEDGYDYYRGRAVVVVPDSGQSEQYVCEAIRDYYRVSNCQHEYDCCGCLSVGVHEIVRMDDGIYEVFTSGSRNY